MSLWSQRGIVMSHRRRSENGLTIRRPRKNNSRGTTLVLSSALKSTTAANTSERSFCVLCATSPCKHSYCRRRITATTSRTPLTSLPTRTSGTPRLPQPPCRTRRTDAKSVCVNLVLVWLQCYACIHVSVLVAQTLSRPWTVAARYAEPHKYGAASLCITL